MFLYTSDILLPDFSEVDGTHWACVACDQYTGEPDYWLNAEKYTADAPSTLKLILPEAFLDETDTRLPVIHAAMKSYLEGGILKEHKNSAVWLERKQADGRLRAGLVCAIDLEDYDFSPNSHSLIRPTERTVSERIPPRVAVRRDALLEAPHVMLLVDDPENKVLGRFSGRGADAYDFALPFGGGSVRGGFVDGAEMKEVNNALEDILKGKAKDPILFAVGDGNHSLATAKTIWMQNRENGYPLDHPSRYALCEVVNLHSEALEFEPIYRLAECDDISHMIAEFEAYADGLHGSAGEQKFTFVFNGTEKVISVKNPEKSLTVATLQDFLDSYALTDSSFSLDYIHGENTLKELATHRGKVGILFDGMKKSELFCSVEADGVLPRKTFSMGHAEDKRFYIECRSIV